MDPVERALYAFNIYLYLSRARDDGSTSHVRWKADKDASFIGAVKEALVLVDHGVRLAKSG